MTQPPEGPSTASHRGSLASNRAHSVNHPVVRRERGARCISPPGADRIVTRHSSRQLEHGSAGPPGCLRGLVLAGASGLLVGAALGTVVAVVCATLRASLACLLARAGTRRPYRALATARVTPRAGHRPRHALDDPNRAARLPRRDIRPARAGRAVRARQLRRRHHPHPPRRVRRRDSARRRPRVLICSPRRQPSQLRLPPALAMIAVLAAMTVGGAAILWRARPTQPGGSCGNRPSRRTDPPQISCSQGQYGR